MVKYERTRLCGCGECRFKPISAGPCPQEKSKTAIWLWSRVVGSDEEVVEESGESGEVTLDTPEAEGETLEEVTA